PIVSLPATGRAALAFDPCALAVTFAPARSAPCSAGFAGTGREKRPWALGITLWGPARGVVPPARSTSTCTGAEGVQFQPRIRKPSPATSTAMPGSGALFL